jgi:hypothetical protein
MAACERQTAEIENPKFQASLSWHFCRSRVFVRAVWVSLTCETWLRWVAVSEKGKPVKEGEKVSVIFFSFCVLY